MNQPTTPYRIVDALITPQVDKRDEKLVNTIARSMAAIFARGVIVGAVYEGTPPETYTSREEELIKKSTDETWSQWVYTAKAFISMGK